MVKHISRCRICGNPVNQVIDLGLQWIQGAFVSPSVPNPNRLLPMTLVRCSPQHNEGACGLVQNKITIPPDILYQNYWYQSGTSFTMRQHLTQIAAEIDEMRGLVSEKPSILDIGCNDGTLLRALPDAWTKWGCDPSSIAANANLYEYKIKLVKGTYPNRIFMVPGLMKFHAITSIACFYDLDDPIGFAKAIASNLHDGGIWICEVAYLPTMLENNDLMTICHEHLCYYTLATFKRVCDTAGLKVVSAKLNDCNGGSIRFYVSKAEHSDTIAAAYKLKNNLQELRLYEFDNKFDELYPYIKFQSNIQQIKLSLNRTISQLREAGKQIHILGASTKGNTLLQYVGLGKEDIAAASDRNPLKHGAHLINGIPIVSEEESRAMKPDVYLVLPWHFRRELIQREAEFLNNGGQFLFPLPTPELVGKEALSEI